MDTGKTYYDTEGNECSIWQMVKREPEWAAKQIQVGESAIAEVAKLRAEYNRLYEDGKTPTASDVAKVFAELNWGRHQSAQQPHWIASRLSHCYAAQKLGAALRPPPRTQSPAFF